MASILYSVNYYRNYNNSDSTKINNNGSLPCVFPNPTTDGIAAGKGVTIWEAPEGTEFIEWNTQRDGSGTSVSAGYSCNNEAEMFLLGTVYAIWGVVSDPIDYLTTDQELTSIANAIRTKGGTSSALVYPTGFVSAIQAISTGTDVSDTTATAGDVLSGKYFYTSSAVKTQGTIATKTSSDLSASGKTVTVPAGYYAQQYTKDVATGTEGTPTATKGTVSNNSVSVTPSVTNSAGYITGGTKTGTAVTVSASELVSGTKTISSSGTTDVTNYASASVAAGTEGTPTATKGTVSNHSVSVTPSVTNTTGYITGSTKTGTAVSVSASELVSGTLTISSSGTKDVTNYESASVAAGSATTPATTITANPSISVNSSGLITATNSKTQSVTPTVSAGYVSSGTAGTITVGGSNTSQLSTQAARTITPTTSDQTISSGKYLTGNQTIKGDANLIAENIAKDVTIFGVTGTHEGGGNPIAEENDVIFIDYDGTIRYSYSASEFANLTELPANPVHAGLTAQGWNWTLSDAKTYVAANGNNVIGQMYTPDDGKTRLYISIPKGSSYKTITLYIAGSDLTIYWGDGTSNYYTDFIYSAQHTYSNTGDYVISISATYFGLGENGIFGQYNTDSYQPYRNMLQKVEISGTNIAIKNYCFYNCRCLKSITLPDNARFDVTHHLFYNCVNLRSVTFPKKSSELSAVSCSYSFQDSGVQKVSYGKNITYKLVSYSLFQGSPIERISIPPTQIKFYDSYFQNCYALREFTVPSNISEIGNNTFNNCIGIQAYHIKRTTPPTLSNVNVFTGIPADCKIYVPSASLSAYKSATNWSTYASYMVGE